MKKLFVITGVISAIIAVILSVLPLSNLAYVPSILALIFGVIALYLSKQKQGSKKTIQLIFILTIIALVITIYKSIFNIVEVGNTEELEVREQKSEEDAIKELNEIEFDEIELDD